MPRANTTSMWQQLRDKAPELTLEVVSIVLAVLVALGVDQWRQSLADAALADTARVGVLEEIGSNRQELLDSRVSNAALTERIQAALASAEVVRELDIRFEFALLSTAAWETAQITGALRHLDFDWVEDISRLHRVQMLFDEAQEGMVQSISGLTVSGPDELRNRLRDLRQRLRVVMEIGEGLLSAYDEVAVEE